MLDVANHIVDQLRAIESDLAGCRARIDMIETLLKSTERQVSALATEITARHEAVQDLTHRVERIERKIGID